MNVPIRAVLFDWGDTLFYSPPGGRVIADAARERGVSLDDDAADRLWNSLWAAGKSPEEIAKGRDLSAEAHRRVWTELFTRADAVVPGVSLLLYDRVMDAGGWQPFPDARPTLRALRERGVPTAVLSNVAADLRPIFRRHGLDELVDAFVLSYEHRAVKPDPAIFLAACSALRTPAENTLMVGDDPITDGGAAGAGLQVLVLPAVASDGRTAAAAADRGLAEVVRLVDRSVDHRPMR